MNASHMSAMQLKHAELDEKLQIENARPAPDDDLIHRLKKQKLALKDMMQREAAPA